MSSVNLQGGRVHPLLGDREAQAVPGVPHRPVGDTNRSSETLLVTPWPTTISPNNEKFRLPLAQEDQSPSPLGFQEGQQAHVLPREEKEQPSMTLMFLRLGVSNLLGSWMGGCGVQVIKLVHPVLCGVMEYCVRTNKPFCGHQIPTEGLSLQCSSDIQPCKSLKNH